MFLRAYCFVNVLTLSTHIIQPGLTLVWYSSILLIKSICEFILSVVYCYSERPPLSKIFYYMSGLFLSRNTAALHRSVARDFSGVSQLRLLLLFPFFLAKHSKAILWFTTRTFCGVRCTNELIDL